jgi:N-dimethylarginine dimethylaminohydrolase
MNQHSLLTKALDSPIVYRLPKTDTPLPDIVFVANGGLSLPRLSGPLVLLPNMKYKQRKAELAYLKAMYDTIGIPCMEYPGAEPFEGQAELKWFDGGSKAICGYGFRSTKQTFVELNRFFKTIYGEHSPELLVVPLISSNYYHLDVAMLEYSDSKCIVHQRAFSDTSLKKIMKFLGKENVTVIDTLDSFCLNAVVDGHTLITHRLTDPVLKPMFEKLTGCSVVQIDTSDFERSGGSVRCMTLDVHTAVATSPTQRT